MKMKYSIAILFLLFAIMSATVVAQDTNIKLTNQEIHSGVNSTELTFIVSLESGKTAKAIYQEKEVLDPNKIYIKTSKEVTPEIQSAINNLVVKAPEIFSPVFSEVENLVVNPAIVDGKIVYMLVKEDINKPIFRENEVLQPIFDLRIDKPVEFELINNRIIVNDEQIIDYKEIVRENEVMPPIELEINSAINNGKVYDLNVIVELNSGIFTFIHSNKEVQLPIYSDFKVEDKKIYLIHNEEIHDLKVLPPEIYSAIYDLRVNEPKIVVNELSLKIEDEKPIYDLRVKQPARILWIIPWTVESRYVIDPADGTTKLVDSPWYITSEKLGIDDDDIIFLLPE